MRREKKGVTREDRKRGRKTAGKIKSIYKAIRVFVNVDCFLYFGPVNTMQYYGHQIRTCTYRRSGNSIVKKFSSTIFLDEN
jgi:hypothetical protein